MKNINQRKKSIIVFCTCLIFLSSCSIYNTFTNQSDLSSSNENVVEKASTSKVASDPEFLNGIHEIRNPKTNTQMLVKGDGTVVLKTMEPDIEQIGTIEDIDKNTVNYVYKSFNGEGLETKTYGSGDTEYESRELTLRTVFYDRDGKEVGLTANTYGGKYTTKDKIIYSDNDVPYGENGLRIFNVKTRETTVPQYSNLYAFNGNFLMSTDEYGDDNSASEVTLICDEDFKEIKRIDGYSLNGVETRKGVNLVNLSKRVKSDKDNGDYERKYNYLDENYQFIFDEDIDERMWSDTFPILTVRRGDKVFDFDFDKKQIVGEERPYVKEKNDIQRYQEETAKYEETANKIRGDGEKYQYVSVFYHDGTVLYMAHKEINLGMFDDDTCDIYNDKLELIATFNSVDNQYNEEGYIFVNKDTVYNEKLEVVKKFDKKCMIERIKQFDKVFFANSIGDDYSTRRDFELYDVNFNVLFEHINCIEAYSYDDYIVLTFENNTVFLDKDINPAKAIDGRQLDIRGWYSDATDYKVFNDLANDRMGIIDKDFNIVIDNIKYIETLNEKYFTYQNGFKYGFMDYEGIPILSFSIFDTMREDAVEKDFAGEFVTEY